MLPLLRPATFLCTFPVCTIAHARAKAPRRHYGERCLDECMCPGGIVKSRCGNVDGQSAISERLHRSIGELSVRRSVRCGHVAVPLWVLYDPDAIGKGAFGHASWQYHLARAVGEADVLPAVRRVPLRLPAGERELLGAIRVGGVRRARRGVRVRDHAGARVRALGVAVRVAHDRAAVWQHFLLRAVGKAHHAACALSAAALRRARAHAPCPLRIHFTCDGGGQSRALLPPIAKRDCFPRLRCCPMCSADVAAAAADAAAAVCGSCAVLIVASARCSQLAAAAVGQLLRAALQQLTNGSSSKLRAPRAGDDENSAAAANGGSSVGGGSGDVSAAHGAAAKAGKTVTFGDRRQQRSGLSAAVTSEVDAQGAGGVSSGTAQRGSGEGAGGVVRFANGTQKEVLPDGSAVVRYTNGDTKRTHPRTGVVTYTYAAARTTHTTHPDGTEEFSFPSGQSERHAPDGRKDISFPDGTRKVVLPGGVSESTFPDGVRVVEYPEGHRDVTTPDGTAHREFPDGTVQAL
eukprot:TRINITY_DN11048_c0_g1_i1.p1 TRINITY_DN11048_c0_g1~~TRINITY_DN11048_c0_g1_i1.p1  ORF type:complete len:519 (+),score=105.93 TRINITY_DN11048_c0_g1_i1:349-1905(+)